MKIGFDIDGVLAEIDCAMLRVMDNMTQGKESAEEWYYRDRKPLLDARSFLSQNDELIILTGRPDHLKDTTMLWIKQYYPNAKLFFATPSLLPPKGNTQESVKKWCEAKLMCKASYINNLGLDVYFEDENEGMEDLRKACPKCKIIMYGGRI
jgi:hypothetical protein